MLMSVRTNVSSLFAQRHLQQTQGALDSSMSKLASGFRITKASDDAAGLGISERMISHIRSYNQAVRNANDGVSLVETAEAALNEQTNMLTRLRELAMQSASDGISDTERGYIQNEVTALLNEIDRVANSTKYNGVALLNAVATLEFQVGINNVAANDRISVATVNTTGASLGVSALSLATKAGAQGALGTLDTAIGTISSARATLGAGANRFNHAIASIQSFSEQLSAANSRIRDVDMAEETSRLARAQVLVQAGVGVLAQANQMPTVALKLLG